MQSITRRARRAVVAGAVLLSASAAWGGINDTWDWVNDPASGKPKRTLAIYYNFTEGDKLGDLTMKQVMDEAMANWNGVKGETGWEFVLGTAGSHDIEIKTGDIPKPSGGAATTGSAGKDRTVSKLTITFDPTPAEGFQWGSNDDAKKNAVSNAKHELSHTLRLAHQGGTRSKTEKIADPQGHDTKDDDVLTISPTDKTEAKNAGDPNTTTLYLALSGAAVPEPSSSLLVLAGLISGCLRRRKRD
jgi:hypothetical protein